MSVDVEVRWNSHLVGRLLDVRGRVHFQYAASFLPLGIELSPFKLPLGQKVFSDGVAEFHGLHGLFHDALPDGWGLLLMHRRMRELGVDPERLSVLTWLRYIGPHAMGALSFHPSEGGLERGRVEVKLRQLEAEAQRVHAGKARTVLPALALAGGSPGGARPKVVVGIAADDQMVAGAGELPTGYEHWLIKFGSRGTDPSDIGALEEAYARLARHAGIDVPPSRLFTLDGRRRVFGVRRFDRRGNERIHLHSIGGLLHASHRLPSLDYQTILTATLRLTRDRQQGYELLRRAAFNVLLCNRDDHAHNFSFLMSNDGEWRLSPAYDLTPNAGPGGYHSTSVMGEALKPSRGHLVELARSAQLDDKASARVLRDVEEAARAFQKIARQVGVTASTTRRVVARLAAVRRDYSG